MPAIPQKQFIKAYQQLFERMSFTEGVTPSQRHNVFFGNRFRWALKCSRRESDGTRPLYLAITLFHYHHKVLEVHVFDDQTDTPVRVIKHIDCTSVSDRDGINSLLYLLNIDQRVKKGTTYDMPDSAHPTFTEPSLPTIRL